MPSSGVQTCALDRKSTRLNSSHTIISYAVFCLKKKTAGGVPAGAWRRPPQYTRHARARLPTHRVPRVVCRDVRVRPARGAASALYFFFNDTATTEISTLSLHDALPICLNSSHTIISYAVFCLRDYRVTGVQTDRKSTRLNSSHTIISYAVFCFKKKQCWGPWRLTRSRCMSWGVAVVVEAKWCRDSLFFKALVARTWLISPKPTHYRGLI